MAEKKKTKSKNKKSRMLDDFESKSAKLRAALEQHPFSLEVIGALFRVFQNLIGSAQLLKFGGCIPGPVAVRVQIARPLTERSLDLIRRGCRRNAQGFVIAFKIKRIGQEASAVDSQT